MSGKQSSPRHSPSPSSPGPPPSKLPKFFQNKANRDRSRSMTEPAPGASTSSLSGSSAGGSTAASSTGPEPQPGTNSKIRKGSRFLGRDKDRDRDSRRSTDSARTTDGRGSPSSFPTAINEPPIIIEPASVDHAASTPHTPIPPRSRTRSERPLSSAASSPQPSLSLFTSGSNANSTPRIGDLPTRLSGWFSHTFSTSSTDLSLPSLLATHHAQSPSRAKPNPLLTVAKHGKGHLDKAMRYLLDSDATPDKCTDPIWILGVMHPGWEPPPPAPPPLPPSNSAQEQGHHVHGLSSSAGPGGAARRTSSSSPPTSFRSSTSSIEHLSLSQSASSASGKHQLHLPHYHSNSNRDGKEVAKDPSAHWPPVFYADFTSRVWLTYRSHFPVPIRDGRLGDLCSPLAAGDAGSVNSAGSGSGGSASGKGSIEMASSPTTVRRSPWAWGGEKAWNSDSGWGCMLRTGQSLLANSLVHLHLGRDWRRPPQPVRTADFATYVQILTWFLDTPRPEAPFSVHRMALAGKELGTDVGQWFGPSVAAGAIKTLVHAFPECGMGVSVAMDGTLYQSDVFAASHADLGTRDPKRTGKAAAWGDRPVLLLLGIRLGIDSVNPIYYETIKQLYTFPQSVGIAGGRPSSSYYFVGSQADNLFYLDPHNPRPAIPLRPPPSSNPNSNHNSTNSREREPTPESDKDSGSIRNRKHRSASASYHSRAPTSPSSSRTGSSTFSYHAPTSPSPLQQQFSTSSTDSSASNSNYPHSRSPPPSNQQHGPWTPSSQPGSPGASEMDYRELGMTGGGGGGLDPVQEHYVMAYSAAELKTFHCDRVRKMPLSGLDPSMLIGFLCRDETDWWDFRKRVGELPRTIFSVQDEPPNWSSDLEDNVGLESMSDELDMDMDDEEDGSGEQFFDTRSESPSNSSQQGQSERSERSRSEEIDTEEDPVDPITPGPSSKFAFVELPEGGKGGKSKDVDFDPEGDEEPFDNDIEDDWVEPSLPTPTPAAPFASQSRNTDPQQSSSPLAPSDVPPLVKSKSSGSTSKKKKGKKQVPVPVPVVRLPSAPVRQQSQEHYPFPVTLAGDTSPTPQDRSRTGSGSNKGGSTGGKRMHTARARDGGRTQSGGVKGILPDDGGS